MPPTQDLVAKEDVQASEAIFYHPDSQQRQHRVVEPHPTTQPTGGPGWASRTEEATESRWMNSEIPDELEATINRTIQPPWAFMANLDITDAVSMTKLAQYFHMRLEDLFWETEHLVPVLLLTPDEVRTLNTMYEESCGSVLLTEMLKWFASSHTCPPRRIAINAQKLASMVTIHVREPRKYPGAYAEEAIQWEETKRKLNPYSEDALAPAPGRRPKGAVRQRRDTLVEKPKTVMKTKKGAVTVCRITNNEDEGLVDKKSKKKKAPTCRIEHDSDEEDDFAVAKPKRPVGKSKKKAPASRIKQDSHEKLAMKPQPASKTKRKTPSYRVEHDSDEDGIVEKLKPTKVSSKKPLASNPTNRTERDSDQEGIVQQPKGTRNNNKKPLASNVVAKKAPSDRVKHDSDSDGIVAQPKPTGKTNKKPLTRNIVEESEDNYEPLANHKTPKRTTKPTGHQQDPTPSHLRITSDNEERRVTRTTPKRGTKTKTKAARRDQDPTPSFLRARIDDEAEGDVEDELDDDLFTVSDDNPVAATSESDTDDMTRRPSTSTSQIHATSTSKKQNGRLTSEKGRSSFSDSDDEEPVRSGTAKLRKRKQQNISLSPPPVDARRRRVQGYGMDDMRAQTPASIRKRPVQGQAERGVFEISSDDGDGIYVEPGRKAKGKARAGSTATTAVGRDSRRQSTSTTMSRDNRRQSTSISTNIPPPAPTLQTPTINPNVPNTSEQQTTQPERQRRLSTVSLEEVPYINVFQDPVVDYSAFGYRTTRAGREYSAFSYKFEPTVDLPEPKGRGGGGRKGKK